jgi:hypothetical protein
MDVRHPNIRWVTGYGKLIYMPLQMKAREVSNSLQAKSFTRFPGYQRIAKLPLCRAS